MKDFYFDYAGTTPVSEDVYKEMEPYLREEFGNASSIYKKGREAKEVLEDARKKIADVIQTDPSEIIFTSGATEASNLAIRGTAFFAKKEGRGNHIITTQIEHPSVLSTIKDLEKNYGFSATYLPVDSHGLVNVEDIKKAITDKTILVSVMWANNEVGTIEPILEIGETIHEINKIREAERKHKVYFHTDAVQVIQFLDINLKEQNIDFMSATGHKFYAPKGVGFLYARRGSQFLPQQIGGHQEKNRRAGTENISGIAAMAKALEEVKKTKTEESKRLLFLRDKIISKISKIKDIKLTGHPEKRLPHIASFVIKYVEGESLLLRLDRKGIYAATGSACSSDSLEPSHVLLALGVKKEIAHGSLRISLGKYTDEKQVNYLLKELPKIIEDLREMSSVKGDF